MSDNINFNNAVLVMGNGKIQNINLLIMGIAYHISYSTIDTST